MGLNANMGRRGFFVASLAWAVLIAGVATVWIRYGDATLETVATVLACLVALAPLTTKLSPYANGPQPGMHTGLRRLDEAATAFGRVVRTQWETEQRRRLLAAPDSMPVRWAADRRFPAGALPADLPPNGDLQQVVDKFLARPHRLVVTGEPGAGKTSLAVLLTLELLANQPQGWVPVLLQLSSWDPKVHLHTWISRRLAEDYPWLEQEYGGEIVTDLLTHRRLLPVLDGLDEVPVQRRRAMLTAIERDTSPTCPLVLACRDEEFLAATADRGLHGALMVRLLPLTPVAAAAYLIEAFDSPQGDELDRWDPVLQSLTDREDSPLATVLTRPLMLYLARVAYQRPDTVPAELLDESRFGTAERLEQHLLDAFVPAVFDNRPPPPGGDLYGPRVSWRADQAERWLSFLAGHLADEGTRDLAWWRLRRVVPRSFFLVVHSSVGAVICGALGTVTFGMFGRPLFGLIFGLLLGAGGSLGLGLGLAERERRPRRLTWRLSVRRGAVHRPLGLGLFFALVAALVSVFVVGPTYGWTYGMSVAMVFALVFGAAPWLAVPAHEEEDAASPDSLLRSDRAAIGQVAMVGGIVGAMIGGFLLGALQTSSSHELALDVSSPVALVLLGVCWGACVGAVGLALMVEASGAWGRLVTTRVWLAVHGLAPLRLMTFLGDAHRLGVLRQVGAVYQFRHAVLQDRLAQRPPCPVPVAAPAPVASAPTAPVHGSA